MTPLRTLIVSCLVLALGSAVASKVPHGSRDNNSIPEVVVPNPSTISAGDSTTVTVTMNENVTSDTVVNLSSNSSLLSVPSTVTVPSGSDSAQFTAQSSGGRPTRSLGSEDATITASCNGGQAQGTVYITGIGGR